MNRSLRSFLWFRDVRKAPRTTPTRPDAAIISGRIASDKNPVPAILLYPRGTLAPHPPLPKPLTPLASAGKSFFFPACPHVRRSASAHALPASTTGPLRFEVPWWRPHKRER